MCVNERISKSYTLKASHSLQLSNVINKGTAHVYRMLFIVTQPTKLHSTNSKWNTATGSKDIETDN